MSSGDGGHGITGGNGGDEYLCNISNTGEMSQIFHGGGAATISMQPQQMLWPNQMLNAQFMPPVHPPHQPQQQQQPTQQHYNDYMFNMHAQAQFMAPQGQPETYSVLPVGRGNFLKLYHCAENASGGLANDGGFYHQSHSQQFQQPSPPQQHMGHPQSYHLPQVKQTQQSPPIQSLPTLQQPQPQIQIQAQQQTPTQQPQTFHSYELFSSRCFPESRSRIEISPQSQQQQQQQQQQLHSKQSAMMVLNNSNNIHEDLPSASGNNINSTTNMIINKLVNNWSPNLTGGSYSQFGNSMPSTNPTQGTMFANNDAQLVNHSGHIEMQHNSHGNLLPNNQPTMSNHLESSPKSLLPNLLNAPQLPQGHQQLSPVAQKPSIILAQNPVINDINDPTISYKETGINNSAIQPTSDISSNLMPTLNHIPEVKKRIVAEVKPMRMSYSDVLSKMNNQPQVSLSQTANKSNHSTGKMSKSIINGSQLSTNERKSDNKTATDVNNGGCSNSRRQQNDDGKINPKMPTKSPSHENKENVQQQHLSNVNSSYKSNKRVTNNVNVTNGGNNQQQQPQQPQHQPKQSQPQKTTAKQSNSETSIKKRQPNNINNANVGNTKGTDVNPQINSKNQKDNNSTNCSYIPSGKHNDHVDRSVHSSTGNTPSSGCSSNSSDNGNTSSLGNSNSNGPQQSATNNRKTNKSQSNVTSASYSNIHNSNVGINSYSSNQNRSRYSNANSNSTSSYSYSSKRNRSSNVSSSYNSYGSSSAVASNRNYELAKKFMQTWLEYTVKILTWLYYLLYDIIVLGFSMVYDRLMVGYECAMVYMEQLKKDLRQNSNKPSLWIKNFLRRFDARFQKNSRWAIWRYFYKKKPPEVSTSSFKNGRLPQTGDDAMYSLLNCKGKDAYSILGVPPDSSQEQIRKHYKKIAVLVHPDKNKQPGAEEAFKVLQRAFELIGEPENRQSYDQSLAEALHAEKAWTELHDLLSQLQFKITEAANTIRCSTCSQRHPRKLTDRPHYAARACASCKIHHSAREGDIWAETSLFGLRWNFLALMEGKVYDITEWAHCQKGALSHLEPNSHMVQYRIVRGGQQNQQQQQNQPQQTPQQQQHQVHHQNGNSPGHGQSQYQQQQHFTGRSGNNHHDRASSGRFHRDMPPTDDTLHEFLDNLYSGQHPNSPQSAAFSSSSRRRSRRN